MSRDPEQPQSPAKDPLGGSGEGSAASPGKDPLGGRRRPTPAGGRRRPNRLRRWIVRPFVWGLVLLAVVLVGLYYLVLSDFTKERLAALVVARTSAALGRPLRVGSVDYTFVPLGFELRDVVLPGPRPSDPPVAVVPLIRVQSDWRALRRKVLELRQIDVERPRVYLQFNPDGSSNLPHFRSSGGGQSRFETRIGRVLVQGGELRINQRQVPLAIDARAIWGRLTGVPGSDRLDALVTAQEVVTTLPNAKPYPVTLAVKGSLLPKAGKVRLAAFRFSGPEVRASGDGEIGWKGGAQVALRFRADGATVLANRLGYLEAPIAGPFAFAGRFDYAGGDWRYAGEATSPRVAILNRTFSAIAARLDGRAEGLRVDVERAGYAGGTVKGEVRVDTAADGPGKPVALDLTYTGLSLATLLADQEAPPVGISGSAGGTLKYRFRSPDPLGGSGTANVALAARQGERGLAVSGVLPLTIDRGIVTAQSFRLTAPAQSATGSGSIDLEKVAGQIDFDLLTEDLGGLAAVLPSEPAGTAEPSPLTPTAGHGHATGTVRFTGDQYVLETRLDLEDVATPALAADRLTGTLRLDPRAVDDLDLLATRGHGTLAVTGRVPLPDDAGRMPSAERLAIDLDAASWPAAGLAAFLPGGLAVTGELSGKAAVGGTFDSLNGHAEVRLADLTVAGYEMGRAQAAVAFDGPALRIERGVAELPAGDVILAGSLDRATGALALTVDAPTLLLAREPLAGLLQGTTGEASLAVAVEGTLDHPQATLVLHGSDLAFAGRPLGEAGRAELLASWDGETVRGAGSLLGLVNFDGGGRLDRQGADVSFAVKSDDLGRLARVGEAVFADGAQAMPEFTGAFAGTVAAKADFAAGTYGARLTLDHLGARYAGREIANLEPVVVAVAPGRVDVVSFYLGEKEHDTELFVKGSLGLGEHNGSPGGLDLKVQSTVWIGWLNLALPDYSFSGFADFLATVRGTLSDPVLNGEGVLRSARVIVPSLPRAVEDIEGTVYFDHKTVVLDRITANFAGGKLTSTGSVELPVAGAPLRYQIQLLAKDVSVGFPEDFLSRGDAQVALSGNAEGRQVRGTVDLHRVFYLEDVQVSTFQLLQKVLQRSHLEVAATDDSLSSTQLYLAIKGPDALRVRNNVANLEGDVDLLVRGTAARPVIFGKVELGPGGKLTYNDTEYKVERGLLTFENPYRVDPVIDLVASTEVQSYQITLTLTGTLDRLQTSFASNANLADLEILSLLATGDAGQGEAQLFAPTTKPDEPSLGAGGFLAGQAASAVSKRVGSLFGFDRFRISPIAGESGSSLGGVSVTVGKRLSKDVFVTYSSNPSSTRQDVVQVEWRVADAVTLVLTSSSRGYAVDAQWEKRF